MLKEKIQENLKKALKTKDEVGLSTLRLLTSAIKNFEIDKGGAGYQASDEEIISTIQKQVKQRKESIEQFSAAGRQELAEKETKEMEVLQKYLPKQMSQEEISRIVEKAIKETGASSIQDMGKVMGQFSSELKGKADMGLVGQIVRDKLTD